MAVVEFMYVHVTVSNDKKEVELEIWISESPTG
jgi:hypothetical protein